jgi:transposase InsO family protein
MKKEQSYLRFVRIDEYPEFAKVNRPRVTRHMKEMGLKCRTIKKFVVTTDSKHKEPVLQKSHRNICLLNKTFNSAHLAVGQSNFDAMGMVG